MKTVTHALFWRQWSLVKYPAIGAFTLSLLAILLDLLMHALDAYDEKYLVFAASVCTITSYFFALYLFILGTETENITAAFPSVLLTLPVRSWRLAVHELAGRTFYLLLVPGIIGLACLSANCMVAPPETWPHISQNGLLHALLVPAAIVAVYSVVQVVIWCPLGAPALITTFFAALFVSPIRQACKAVVGELATMTVAHHLCVAFAVIGVSYAMACLVVRFVRGGASSFSFEGLALPTFAHRHGFRSPLAAQRWLEWHAFGRTIPGLALGFVAVLALGIYYAFLTFMPTASSDASERTKFAVPFLATLYAPICVSIAAFIVGTLLFFRDIQEHSRLLSFVFVRPMSTPTLASARLRTGVMSLGLTALLLTAFIALLHLGSGSGLSSPLWRQAFDIRDSNSLFVSGVSYVFVFLLWAWVLLWLSSPIIAVLAVLAYPLAIFAQTIYPLIVVSILACAVYAWRAKENGIVSVRTLVLATIGWGLIGAFVHWYADFNSMRPSGGDPTGAWIPFLAEETVIWGVALLPVLPVISVPYTINWLRHR